MSAFDLKLAEMLTSRLCHDLVNPIGAVANGVELLSEFCDTMQKDALDLISSSVDRAMKRVAFFRVAYGFAGHDEGQSVQEVRGLAEGFLAGGKVTLDWPAKPEDAAVGLRRGGLKLLLAVIVLAAELLPRGGRLSISVEPPGGARVMASGAGARIEFAAETMLTTLMGAREPELASLEAKNVGAAYVGRLARAISAKLAVEPGPDRVSFVFSLS